MAVIRGKNTPVYASSQFISIDTHFSLLIEWQFRRTIEDQARESWWKGVGTYLDVDVGESAKLISRWGIGRWCHTLRVGRPALRQELRCLRPRGCAAAIVTLPVAFQHHVRLKHTNNLPNHPKCTSIILNFSVITRNIFTWVFNPIIQNIKHAGTMKIISSRLLVYCNF